MVKFRFSIILLCVLLPPLFYVLTLHAIEQYAARRVQAGLESTFLGPIEPLLEGSVDIRAAIERNVAAFLSDNRWVAWGGQVVVTIKTDGNTLLYPSVADQSHASAGQLGAAPWQIAAENFRLLNANPNAVIAFRLPHFSPIANAVLTAYLSMAIGLLFLYIRRWKAQYQLAMAQQADTQQNLARKGRLYEQQLSEMETDRARLNREVMQIQEKFAEAKRRAATAEEEMVEELVALEEELAAKAEKQAQFQDNIHALHQKIVRLETQLQKEQSRRSKSGDALQKRMSALYKKVELSERALDGYLDLNEDLKIRCEEVIHQLDADPSKVVVKRKVFGKKNRETIFEVVFGYKGRFYFLSKEGKKHQVLAIGTKNSQQQDLEFLNRL